MTPTNCPRCRKLFNKIRSSVCPACEKIEEEQFDVLRRFLQDNPKSSITEASEASEVPPKRILRYIREGRLVVPEGSPLELRCAQCGVNIYEGIYCSSCSKKMAGNLAGALSPGPAAPVASKPKPATSKSSGMHTKK